MQSDFGWLDAPRARLLPNFEVLKPGRLWEYGCRTRAGDRVEWLGVVEVKERQVCIGCWQVIGRCAPPASAKKAHRPTRAYMQTGTWLWRCLKCGPG